VRTGWRGANVPPVGDPLAPGSAPGRQISTKHGRRLFGPPLGASGGWFAAPLPCVHPTRRGPGWFGGRIRGSSLEPDSLHKPVSPSGSGYRLDRSTQWEKRFRSEPWRRRRRGARTGRSMWPHERNPAPERFAPAVDSAGWLAELVAAKAVELKVERVVGLDPGEAELPSRQTQPASTGRCG
jgi:hypothetical protein